MRSPFVLVTTLAGIVASFITAYAGATGIYVIDNQGIRVERGWPLSRWSASRTQVADARVIKGLFRWMLVLTLASGREKRLILSESMRRAMGARLEAEVRSRPTML